MSRFIPVGVYFLCKLTYSVESQTRGLGAGIVEPRLPPPSDRYMTITPIHPIAADNPRLLLPCRPHPPHFPLTLPAPHRLPSAAAPWNTSLVVVAQLVHDSEVTQGCQRFNFHLFAVLYYLIHLFFFYNYCG